MLRRLLSLLRPVPNDRSLVAKHIWNDASHIEQKIKELVAEQFKVDISEVTPEKEWERDFGASLDVVEVFMLCEEAFEIEIPDDAASDLINVGQLTTYVQQRFGVRPT